MKSIIFFAFFSLSGFILNAQCNVDMQTPSTRGLYSNPLPPGSLGVSYSQSVTMVFPTHSDTTINIPGFGNQTFTAYYTSFQVQQVSGIPQGMTMPLSSCNQANCTYSIVQNQTNRGCMLLSGTPTESGTFQVTTTNYTNGYTIMPFSIPFTGPNAGDTIGFDDPRLSNIPGLTGIISGFRTQTYSTPLQILSTSISKPQKTLQAQIYPNPGKSSILKWHGNGDTFIHLYNSLGTLIFKTQINSQKENSIELPNLPNGLYIIELRTSESSQAIQWICE